MDESVQSKLRPGEPLPVEIARTGEVLKPQDRVLACAILMAAKNLIRDPDRWMQGGQTDGRGRYCMIGALAAVWSSGLRREASVALWRLKEECGGHDVWRWNDVSVRTHEQVMGAFDRAIEKLKEGL